MPVRVSGESFGQFIDGVEANLVTPDLMIDLGESMANRLVSGFNSSGLVSRSGASVAALSFVSEPQETGTGMSIGVANADELGDPGDPAPRGTLREFFTDYKRAFPGENIRPSKWKDIPRTYKEFLESERRSGMYGGRGPDYANYLWAQEQGNAAADIPAHPFIDAAIDEWQDDAMRIIEEHLAKASGY